MMDIDTGKLETEDDAPEAAFVEWATTIEEEGDPEAELQQQFLNDASVLSSIDIYEGVTNYEFAERFSFRATKLG